MEQGLKVCSNSHGSKLSPCPYKVRINKTSPLESRTEKALRLNLDVDHWKWEAYQICSNDDPRLSFDLFSVDQLCFPIHFYGENGGCGHLPNHQQI